MLVTLGLQYFSIKYIYLCGPLQEKFRREFKARIPCLRRILGGADSSGGTGGGMGAVSGANGAGATSVAGNNSITMATSLVPGNGAIAAAGGKRIVVNRRGTGTDFTRPINLCTV
jgi:hypothetical protein